MPANEPFFRLLKIEEIYVSWIVINTHQHKREHNNMKTNCVKFIGFTMIALALLIFTTAQAQSVIPAEMSSDAKKASITSQEARQLARGLYLRLSDAGKLQDHVRASGE